MTLFELNDNNNILIKTICMSYNLMKSNQKEIQSNTIQWAAKVSFRKNLIKNIIKHVYNKAFTLPELILKTDATQ